MIQVLLWAPLAAGLIAAVFPGRSRGGSRCSAPSSPWAWRSWLVAQFDSGAGLQHTVDESWIPDLGVRYQLGIDGISLFLVLLTAVLWLAATLWSALNTPDRLGTWFLMFGLAETAVLGAFLAQDLILFVLFFDLMLIPFYFLFRVWGTEHPGRAEEDEGPIRPQPAVIKMIVYTLVGSLLMLAGAIATGILAADGGRTHLLDGRAAGGPARHRQPVLDLLVLRRRIPGEDAGLPAPRLDARRLPGRALPALALFSGVLSKVGAYGFLRVVLPIFPDATTHFQEVIILVAVVSILYGSAMAFTQTSARLVAGYSSVAQLGFITLGIFSLRPDGADGAVLQMVNHGLVVAPLLLIVVVLAARVGTDDITRMGGLAMRAPVLAAMFLIVTMALLAMPGSANFVGEFYILNGIFQEKVVYAFVASVGIALAAYYALRLYQAAMHNRKPEGLESREVGWGQGGVIAALTACIVALALWPGLILDRAEDSVDEQLAATNQQTPAELAQR